MSDSQAGAVDLDSCANEPIHIPARIQSFGALVAVSSDWLIAHCSQNLAALLKLPSQPQPGDPLGDYLSSAALAGMRRKLQAISAPGGVERSFGEALVPGGALFDTALHVSGRTIVIEFEPHVAAGYDHSLAILRPMMARLEHARDPARLCEVAARQLKALLGFDRVMVYRFHPDDTGEVIAEAREMRLESFFGLHYPASDIPPQARKLYLTNLLRIISDIGDQTVAIVPTVSPAGTPLDLSQSTLRGVSPIHIEYLRNMGVTASMSISIVVRGKLWGLFACHHYSGPRVVPYSLRTFTETIGGRIHALALAHDAITRENWAPISLTELIQTEAKAYLSDKADRLVIEGEDALIAPEAFSVVALVIHELLTNSVKYGSLCDSRGQVRLGLSTTAEGKLVMAWRESGGPAVQAPKRRGFGSLIVERSIPHELKGEAAIRFELGGLEADFTLPARFVSKAPARSAAQSAASEAIPTNPGRLPHRVLLVEDNMIIAIDTEENLLALGVGEVVLASSNDAALAAIDGNLPDFGLLDFNLGGETSEPIARALDSRGVPFAFATGYGEVEGMTGTYAHSVGVLQKPYSKEDLARILSRKVSA